MRTGDLLYSGLQFILSVLVVFTGVLFLGLHYEPYWLASLLQFLSTSSLLFFLGCLFFGGGVLLLVGFYRMHRGVYYQICMQTQTAFVDPQLIQKYVEAYWKECLPDQELLIQVRVTAQQKIEIYMQSKLDQQALLTRAEADLGNLLKEQFGYSRDFLFSVKTS